MRYLKANFIYLYFFFQTLRSFAGKTLLSKLSILDIFFSYQLFIRLIMSNYRVRDKEQPKIPSEQEVLHELQQEQLEITNIKKQRDIILKVEETIFRKDKQINRLNALVQKYMPYYHQYSQIKINLAEKQSANRTLTKENQLLRREFQQLIVQCESLTTQHKQLEHQRDTLIRERHAFDRMNRDIEDTFKEYQMQCKIKENDLIRELQNAQNVIEELKKELSQAKKTKVIVQETQNITKLKEENKHLRSELAEKDRELLKYKKLNNQISVQFDKSVSKIVEFQRELNEYRRDNHQLKKTLGLVLQQEKYQKFHQKYMKKNKSKAVSEQEDSEQQQQEEQINHSSDEHYVGESSPSMSEVKY